MAEVINYQEIYSKLGEMQSNIDELFLQSVENSEFRSASVIVRMDIGLKRSFDSADIQSDEYKNSAFAKGFVDLSRSLFPPDPIKKASLQVRFIWSDASYMLGSAALNPILRSDLANVYIQSVIRLRYRNSIQEMFGNSDRGGNSPVPGSIRVVLQIGEDGKVSEVSFVDEKLRGSLIFKNIEDMVKNWSFPGIKSSIKVNMALVRASLCGSSKGSLPIASQVWVLNFGWMSFQDWMNFSQSQSFSPNPWVSVLAPTLPLPPPREFPFFYATPSVPIPPPYSYSMSSSSSGLASQASLSGHSGYFGDDPIPISSQSRVRSAGNEATGNPCIIDPLPPSMRLPYLPISEVRGNLQGTSIGKPSPDPWATRLQSRYTLDYGVLDYGIFPPY